VTDYADGHDAMMFCKLAESNPSLPLHKLMCTGDSWFTLPDLGAAISKGLTSSDPFDVTQYDNRALYIISAICLTRDVCPWPVAGGRGVPAPGHKSADFGGNTGYKYLSTPSAVKLYNKRRTGFLRLLPLSNVDGYAW
jgi:hypothetical protein